MLNVGTRLPGAMLTLLCAVLVGCASTMTTSRDKTARGAGIGAASGAVIGAIVGEGEVDKILAGAAIGAVVGASIGAYMDAQEEKLARIPNTRVERVGEDMLLVRFDSDVFFAVDSAMLNPGSQNNLNVTAGVLMEFNKTAVIVQGHTDSTGSEQYNQALSERRAQSVFNHLIGYGVGADRMTAVGYGEGYPIADNATSEGRQLNRRVDLLLKAKAR